MRSTLSQRIIKAYAYRQLYVIYQFEMTILAYNDFCPERDMNRRIKKNNRKTEKRHSKKRESRAHINSVTGSQKKHTTPNRVKPKNYAEIQNRIWNGHILRWPLDNIDRTFIACSKVSAPLFWNGEPLSSRFRFLSHSPALSFVLFHQNVERWTAPIFKRLSKSEPWHHIHIAQTRAHTHAHRHTFTNLFSICIYRAKHTGEKGKLDSKQQFICEIKIPKKSPSLATEFIQYAINTNLFYTTHHIEIYGENTLCTCTHTRLILGTPDHVCVCGHWPGPFHSHSDIWWSGQIVCGFDISFRWKRHGDADLCDRFFLLYNGRHLNV